MALNALIDSFLPQSEKWGTERVKNVTQNSKLTNIRYDLFECLCRRMFPALKFKVSGLDQDTKYSFLLDIVPVDSYRYYS